MTIRTSPLSKLFNSIVPDRVARLNRDLLAHASIIHGGEDEEKLWVKIQRLLRAGAQINTTNGNGDTALHLLCEQRHGFAVGKMLEHGASMEMVNKTGMTAFLTGARVGEPEILKAFIANHVDLNQATQPQGENAINVLLGFVPLGADKLPGAPERRVESLKVLVDAGMKLDKSSSMRVYHHSPQYLPAVPEIAKIHALSDAINAGDTQKAREVIAGGVHPDATAEFGDQSALAFGAAKGDLALIDDALKAGAKINLTSGDQRATALQEAVARGQREAFVHLLDAGANPHQMSSRYDAPQLYNAAKVCEDPGMWKFVSDIMHDRDRENLVLQTQMSVSRVLRFKRNEPGQ